MNKIELAVLFFVFISFAIVTPITIWALQWQNRLRGVITPEGFVDNLKEDFPSENSTLSIVPPDMLKKYDNEVRSLNWFVAFLLGIGLLGVATIFTPGPGFFYLGCIILGCTIILLPMGFYQRNRSITEKVLANQARGEGLTLKPDGFSSNIALFESGYRGWLLQNQYAIGSLKWNEIKVLRVKPSKTYSHGSSPPFYEFVLKTPINKTAWWKDSIEVVFILREGFYQSEQNIINYIKSHAHIPIEIYDDLRTEETCRLT